MSSIRGRATALLIALSLVAAAPGAHAARTDVARDLAAVLTAFLAANPSAPGAAVHVVCPPHGLDTTLTVGLARRDVAEPLTAAHTFRIASNTKTYVAAAVLRLVEDGRLGLDDALADHLAAPRARLLRGDGYDLDAITIAHVLGHTAGLAEHPADPRYAEAIMADPMRVWTADEQVRLCVAWRDPVAAPGDTFSYSDTGYVLLGGIVEDITGENLGAAVHHLLDYERLGLRATWWEVMEPAPAGAGPRAHQYYGDADTHDWHPSLDLYGGGGLVTDARDLARFLRLLLDGKVLREPASLEAMTSRGADDYRLGVFHLELAGYEAWGHTGFWNTFAYHVPELDLTVAGVITDHFAEPGRTLAVELVGTVAAP
jgi:D-alanyl-D-alanine carboxypeptidase